MQLTNSWKSKSKDKINSWNDNFLYLKGSRFITCFSNSKLFILQGRKVHCKFLQCFASIFYKALSCFNNYFTISAPFSVKPSSVVQNFENPHSNQSCSSRNERVKHFVRVFSEPKEIKGIKKDKVESFCKVYVFVA